MKRTIFAVVFCLAAASTAVAADDSLAGLIQAGNRDAALKQIAAGADVNAAQGDGTTPLHWAVDLIAGRAQWCMRFAIAPTFSPRRRHGARQHQPRRTCFANGFASSRARSMKSRATGLSVRFFSV